MIWDIIGAELGAVVLYILAMFIGYYLLGCIQGTCS